MNLTANDRLKEIREHLNKNQKEMAASLGVQPSYYSEVERGKRGITSKIAETLSSAFNVSTDWLYTGDGEMIKPSEIPQHMLPLHLRAGISKVFNNITEYKRLEKKYSAILKAKDNLQDFYDVVIEIGLFKDALDEIFNKYLAVWVELPLKSNGDKEYIVNTLNESASKIAPYKEAFEQLAEAIKKFNFEMYNAGANEFEYTQHMGK